MNFTTSFPSSPPAALSAPTQVWRVTRLCIAMAQALQTRFNPVSVQGELVNVSKSANGHWYFTLADDEDAQGQIRCAMFRSQALRLSTPLQNGQQVQVRGRMDIYTPRGDLQLIVESITPVQDTAGQRYAQFLQLKAKLEGEGLFDSARKRSIPVWPRAIGVVSSLHGAALHDVLTALSRRAPHIPIVVAPSSVQGADASAALIDALTHLQNSTAPHGAPIETILLVRGGGSADDLWAFNDEAVVRAVAVCQVPVISGVGHETDFTLTDFVADLRAATPTAAAELAATPTAQWLDELAWQGERFAQVGADWLHRQAQRQDHLALRLGQPEQQLTLAAHQLQRHVQRLRYALQWRMHRDQTTLDAAQTAHQLACAGHTDRLQRALDAQRQKLALLNPDNVLSRGFAYLTDAAGALLSKQEQFAPGQTVHAHLHKARVNLQTLGLGDE